MNILGISAFVHDSAACLVRDGRVVANVEEERFNRIKHTRAFPAQSIKFVLAEGAVDLRSIDVIAYNWSPLRFLARELSKLLFLLPVFIRILRHNRPPKNGLTVMQAVFLRWHIRRRIGPGFRGRVVWVPHHLAHAASSYYLSPFDRADVLICDGHGETASATCYQAENGIIKQRWSLSDFQSLGVLYSTFTRFLGFGTFQEGSTMALASFGRPDVYASVFEQVIRLLPGGRYTLQKKYLAWWRYTNGALAAQIGLPRDPNAPIEQRHMDLAAALQARVTATVLHMIRHMSETRTSDDLCLAGGLFLNCNINQAVLSSDLYRRAFIPPFASDSGGAVGAALAVARSNGAASLPESDGWLFSPYTGPEYGDSDIERAIVASGLPYNRVDDPSAAAAELLAAGKVIGWFQGRLEAGPRALGNRSILANPAAPGIQDRLNSQVKMREPFRPFAPAATPAEAARCFDVSEPLPAPMRYMLVSAAVRPEVRKQLAGITHVDGSARIQIVHPTDNPLLFDLLEAFRSRTGFGVVLNTSFNLHEPIVCSPADALRTFLTAKLDALVIGHFRVESLKD
jgi:carbamoyltransferase